MKQFKFELKEVYSKIYSVMAEDYDEAVDIIESLWDCGSLSTVTTYKDRELNFVSNDINYITTNEDVDCVIDEHQTFHEMREE